MFSVWLKKFLWHKELRKKIPTKRKKYISKNSILNNVSNGRIWNSQKGNYFKSSWEKYEKQWKRIFNNEKQIRCVEIVFFFVLNFFKIVFSLLICQIEIEKKYDWMFQFIFLFCAHNNTKLESKNWVVYFIFQLMHIGNYWFFSTDAKRAQSRAKSIVFIVHPWSLYSSTHDTHR